MKFHSCCHYAILAATVFTLSSCKNKSADTADQLKPEEYPVTNVFRRNLNIPLEYVASIQAVQNVEIRARVEGYLEDIYVDEGKTVTKGQLLFKINDEEYHAEVNRAKASIAS